MKLVGTAFYPLKDTLDRVSIAVRFVAEMPPELERPNREPRRADYENSSICDSNASPEAHGKTASSTRLFSKDRGRRGVYRSFRDRPRHGASLLAVDVDDRLLEGVLVRISSTPQFEAHLLDAVVDGWPSPFDTKIIENRYRLEQ